MSKSGNFHYLVLFFISVTIKSLKPVLYPYNKTISELKAHYLNFSTVYTVCWKDCDSVACAAVHGDKVVAERLPSNIFAAEARAYLLAC